MKRTFFIPDEESMLRFGATLSGVSKPGDVIFLEGELGAGKTTLTRGFLRHLGYQQPVKSPTYTFVETYLFQNFCVHHFDFYRLEEPAELDHLGLEDYFTNDALVIIEWPEKAGDRLPAATFYCKISINDSAREITIEADSPSGKDILERMQWD